MTFQIESQEVKGTQQFFVASRKNLTEIEFQISSSTENAITEWPLRASTKIMKGLFVYNTGIWYPINFIKTISKGSAVRDYNISVRIPGKNINLLITLKYKRTWSIWLQAHSATTFQSKITLLCR